MGSLYKFTFYLLIEYIHFVIVVNLVVTRSTL